MSKMRAQIGGACMMEYVKTDELVFSSKNPRNHPEEQIEKLINSIRDFGFINPVLIDENNIIIVGNGRTMAAKRIGLTEVPVFRIENLTEEQKKAYAIIENKLTEEGDWNYDLLNSELEAIGLDMTRYGFEEFENMKVIDPEDEQEVINTNTEYEWSDFDDENFTYECDACGFQFN